MLTTGYGTVSLISRMEPMNRQEFKAFVEFLVEQNQLPQECDCDDFFKLCGGIPREARKFGLQKKRLFGDGQSNYEQWRNAYLNTQTPIYKTRIQFLLDKEKLVPQLKDSVSIAARLFIGEK